MLKRPFPTLADEERKIVRKRAKFDYLLVPSLLIPEVWSAISEHMIREEDQEECLCNGRANVCDCAPVSLCNEASVCIGIVTLTRTCRYFRSNLFLKTKLKELKKSLFSTCTEISCAKTLAKGRVTNDSLTCHVEMWWSLLPPNSAIALESKFCEGCSRTFCDDCSWDKSLTCRRNNCYLRHCTICIEECGKELQ
jgi:hypothetical protein